MSETRVTVIRHGQSTFNAAHEEPGRDPGHIDARLSERGQAQVERARRQLRDTPFDLVVTSPLTRALQTTAGIFSGHPSKPTILVEVLHRECQESSCDIGRKASVLAAEFPDFKVGHLPEVWWYADGIAGAGGYHVEPRRLFDARVSGFRDWLRARPERSVAVVGHSTFFYHLTGRWLANCEAMALDLGAEPLALARAHG